MAAADTTPTQVNDISLNGCRVKVPWKFWCHSIQEHKPIHKDDIRMEATIREENERKRACKPIHRIVRGGLEKSRDLMDRALEKVELRVHKAREFLDRYKAHLVAPEPPKPQIARASKTTLTEASSTSLPSSPNQQRSSCEREGIPSSQESRSESADPLLLEKPGSPTSHGSAEASYPPRSTPSTGNSVHFRENADPI